MTRVYVDQLDCTGSGQCEMLVPRLFVVTDDGLATVLDESGTPAADGGEASPVPVPEDLMTALRDAEAVCPGACIHLVDDADR